jgi:hypothetical protein
LKGGYKGLSIKKKFIIISLIIKKLLN